MTLDEAARRLLVAELDAARSRGALGPGPAEGHIDHALAFARSVERPPPSLLDLGSGGGPPGVVLATLWADTSTVLLEASSRRCAGLRLAVSRLGVSGRVTVAEGRAEELAHRPEFRERFAMVTARSFGPPSVTAECGSPFLGAEGLLVVSEPPDPDPARWPVAGLERVGLRDLGTLDQRDAHLRVLGRVGVLPDEVPRARGIPARRPLWG